VHRTLHDCTTLMNSSRVWCTFGTAWTRPSLTVQLMSGVAVFVLVCGQSVDTEQILTFIKILIIQQCDNKRFICDFVSISYDLQGSFM